MELCGVAEAGGEVELGGVAGADAVAPPFAGVGAASLVGAAGAGFWLGACCANIVRNENSRRKTRARTDFMACGWLNVHGTRVTE